MAHVRVLFFAASLAGCGSDDIQPMPSCEDGGACETGCVPGQVELADGSCRDAGVSPEQCGEGFVHDGDGGCEAILPAEACPLGWIAVPGDESCRPLTSCGSAPWGDIGADASTQYVDASYAGGDGNGSAAKPWPTVQQALVAATPGATVAIAEGSYLEDVRMQGKAVTLWGRCPEKVEIVGVGANTGTITLAQADGAVVRGIAIRGPVAGVIASASSDVVLDSVWVDANGGRGLELQESLGPLSLTLRNALIENNHEAGVRSGGADVIVERSVVRGTVPNASGAFGRGISLETSSMGGPRPTALVTGSLVENNHTAGIFAEGVDVVVRSTLVRGTKSDGQGTFGRGISVQSTVGGEPATLLIDGSLLRDNLNVGLSVSASQLIMSGTCVRATMPNMLDGSGWGVSVQDGGAISVSSSLIEESTEIGVAVLGSQAMLESIAVRDTHPLNDKLGHGVHLQTQGQAAVGSLIACAIERSGQVGVAVVGSDAGISGTLVRDTAANGAEAYGDGIMVLAWQGPASLELADCRVEQSARAALSIFGAEAALAANELVCQAFDINGEPVDGQPFELHDLGGNRCGCPEADGECKSASAGLSPPDPLGGP